MMVIFLFIVASCLLTWSNPVGASNAEVSKPVNEFSFELWRNIHTEAENLIYSPFSIVSGFLMVGLGAREQSLRELKAAFGWEDLDSVITTSMKPLLDKFARDPDNGLTVENKLWVEKGAKVLELYRKRLLEDFHSVLGREAFFDEPNKARLRMNEWIAEKTNNKIEHLFQPGSIWKKTQVVLGNVIYYKGKWEDTFNPDDTMEDDFFRENGTKFQVEFMSRQGDYATHFDEDLKLQILELPYEGRQFSMVLVKSLNQSINISDVEKNITAPMFKDWMGALKEWKAMGQRKIFVPKFKLEYALLELIGYLKSLNMTSIFRRYFADLSGIDGGNELWLSETMQRSFIQVDEEGVTAAAAIGVGLRRMPWKPKELKYNQPFIFYIVEKEYDTILFTGKVCDPGEYQNLSIPLQVDPEDLELEDLEEVDLVKSLAETFKVNYYVRALAQLSIILIRASGLL